MDKKRNEKSGCHGTPAGTLALGGRDSCKLSRIEKHAIVNIVTINRHTRCKREIDQTKFTGRVVVPFYELPLLNRFSCKHSNLLFGHRLRNWLQNIIFDRSFISPIRDVIFTFKLSTIIKSSYLCKYRHLYFRQLDKEGIIHCSNY